MEDELPGVPDDTDQPLLDPDELMPLSVIAQLRRELSRAPVEPLDAAVRERMLAVALAQWS